MLDTDKVSGTAHFVLQDPLSILKVNSRLRLRKNNALVKLFAKELDM